MAASDVDRDDVFNRWARIGISVVLAVCTLDWVGWATGIVPLTRVVPTWPQMTPWTALLLATLGVAVLLQLGRPTAMRARAGMWLAVLVGFMALVFLAEYLTHRSFRIDQLWFPDAVRALQSTWPGRPSPQTASSVLLLSVGVALTRLDLLWARAVWPLILVIAPLIPFVTAVAYLFNAISLVGISRATGMGIQTALGLLLLNAATVITRPDRNPVRWLRARPDRTTLFRLAAILAGLPILVGLSRIAIRPLGIGEESVLVLAITLSSVVLGGATFYLSQREQRLLIEKALLSSQQAEAEARYRLLADNAVDIVVHLHGGAVVHLQGIEVAWISPSVEAAFGDPPGRWIGTDFDSRIHPDDVDAVTRAVREVVPGKSVAERFRVSSADGTYHWVDGHGKSYVDDRGKTQGVIVALRIVDDQVEAQRQLEQLARFDPLTGLANRAEVMHRMETALQDSRGTGMRLGVLYCDIDEFKSVNDTWGHGVGDAVLTTMAKRIQKSVRLGDTVGRMGGDEMLVLLPNVYSLEDAIGVAEKIRCKAAEPIHHDGLVIRHTLSIGVTTSRPAESSSTVTSRADVAMYQAKQSGRNIVAVIDPAEH